MQELKQQRFTIQSKLKRFEKYLNDFEDSPDIVQLQLRIANVEKLFDEFSIIQTKIDAKEKIQEDSWEEFENNYYNIISKARRFIEENKIIKDILPNTKNKVINLPQINLPIFNGNIEEWSGFYYSFKNIIHDDNCINPIDKFHYLKSQLKDEAAEILQSLQASEQSYEIAWNLLVNRYHNKRLMIQAHIKALFNISSIFKCTHLNLRTLIDNSHKHIRALKSLDQPTDSWDTILIYLITSKLDKYTNTSWESSIVDIKGHAQLPTMLELLDFLEKRCQILQNTTPEMTTQLNKPKANYQNSKLNNQIVNKQSYASHFIKPNNINCSLCKENHHIYACGKFLSLSIIERKRQIKKLQLCSNCFKFGHAVNNCFSGPCRKCNKKHNTLLHEDIPEQNNEKQIPTITCSNILDCSEILLSTATAEIYDNFKNPHSCRLLLDSGSQSNFITEDLAKKLNLQLNKINIPIVGIAQRSTYVSSQTEIIIKSKINNTKYKIKTLIIPHITDVLPVTTIDKCKLNIPNDIKLADPEFHVPSKIDILIGAELFYEILLNAQIRLNNNILLQNTIFGWIITGKFTHNKTQIKKNRCLFAQELHSEMQRFWEIEEFPEKSYMSKDETDCEEHFAKHTKRSENGRYIVKLPFKHNPTKLGNTYNMAIKQLLTLEKRLEKNINIKTQYNEFLDEYQRLGHMKEVITNGDDLPNFYLPHHAVFKEDSLTTKIRVVFNASAKSTSNITLNEILLVGPIVQESLFSVISRFRLHNYVLSADIEKMYRQIIIHSSDTKFQRILWRRNSNESIKTYELQTVTYGTACASYLATKSLIALADIEKNNFPETARVLKEDIYVDDILTGTKTLQEAHILRDEIIKVLNKGGFHPRKWISNHEDLIKDLKNSKDSLLSLNMDQSVKTLGIYWQAKQDFIRYKINLNDNNLPLTKRYILSQIAKLFDPLGLIGPIITTAKLIMQQLWELKIDWEDLVPISIANKWSMFTDQLKQLQNLIIPRHILINNFIEIQIHGFCDASERAYGACLYMRSKDACGNTQSDLICSKSRVAPLKRLSLPRLELCAACLLIKLYKTTVKALKIQLVKPIFWSDSTIVLHWINTSPHLLNTFIANRIAQIQKFSNSESWKHISSKSNSADIISRGLLPASILSNKLWWNGPEWILQDELHWPVTKQENLKIIPELKRIKANVVQINHSNLFIINKYSSFHKLLRVMIYILRFIDALRNKIRYKDTNINATEIDYATKVIIKIIQNECFSTEIDELKQSNVLIKNSAIKNLNPFIDNENILRVGGRLKNSNLEYDQKYPILLPRSHHVTKLIIKYFHEKNLHCGIQSTLSAIRQKYWPINAKIMIKQIIHQCITCYKHKPIQYQHLMGDLPHERISNSHPFSFVGIDYCGPFLIKERRPKAKIFHKCYVSIFVCFSTKAVHLEMVSDLSTNAFIGTFKRFIARRGKPITIYTDNATNFVGAHRELKDLYEFLNSTASKIAISEYLAEEIINWKFTPPLGPHFGGLWEAAVKSFKFHLRRIMKNHILNFEQFLTLITEIEGILNSRPITEISSDPNDLSALTPFHFLIGSPLTQIPEHNLIDKNVLNIWQSIQQQKQLFWKRWSQEYLHQLQVRSKWHLPKPQVKLGTLVLIKEDGRPSYQWKLGRIIETHAGTDGIVRVATVKTSTSILKRPIRKLFPLPIDSANIL